MKILCKLKSIFFPLKQNKKYSGLSDEDISVMIDRKLVSQTTHIICAKCGGDNEISNRKLSESLSILHLNESHSMIMFECKVCNQSYDITTCKDAD